MGVDLRGWVEVHDDRWNAHHWEGVIVVSNVIQRSYGMSGSLFGVQNSHGFRPVAADRGIPTDAAEHLRAEIKMAETDTVAPSWLVAPSWILWSELDTINWTERGTVAFPPRTQPETRKVQITPSWRMLLRMMRLLAMGFGDNNVRLVVWFDSL